MGQTCAVDARAYIVQSFLAALFDAACVLALSPAPSTWVFMSSLQASQFAAVGFDLHRLEVVLDGVLVAEQGSANFPGATAQFSVENLTRQTVRFHAVHMAQPAEECS